jgi:drug/metabolite transporter (DMT)-like permease
MGQYVQLLFAGVLEYIFFGTVPSTLSLIGAAIIMASAIYVIVRCRFCDLRFVDLIYFC